MSQTLSVRPLTTEVRGPLGVVSAQTIAHCTCPDQAWRDVNGNLHMCKHILHVYAHFAVQMKRGSRTFRVPSFTAPGVVYNVTVFHCTCEDFQPGVFQLCECLAEVYRQAAGFQPDPATAPKKTRKSRAKALA